VNYCELPARSQPPFANLTIRDFKSRSE